MRPEIRRVIHRQRGRLGARHMGQFAHERLVVPRGATVGDLRGSRFARVNTMRCDWSDASFAGGASVAMKSAAPTGHVADSATCATRRPRPDAPPNGAVVPRPDAGIRQRSRGADTTDRHAETPHGEADRERRERPTRQGTRTSAEPPETVEEEAGHQRQPHDPDDPTRAGSQRRTRPSEQDPIDQQLPEPRRALPASARRIVDW